MKQTTSVTPTDMDAQSLKAGATAPLIFAWGHSGEVREAFINKLDARALGTDNIGPVTRYATKAQGSPITVAMPNGETDFTRDHLILASRAAQVMLLIDAGRGVDDCILMQSVLLSHASGLKGCDVIIGLGGAAFSEVRFNEITRYFCAHAELMTIKYVNIVSLTGFKDSPTDDSADRSTALFDPQLFLAGLDQGIPEPKPADFRFAINAYAPGTNAAIAGHVLSGAVQTGGEIIALPSAMIGRVTGIECQGRAIDAAYADDSIGLHLEGHLKVEPGQIMAAAIGRPELADQICARLFWSSATPMLPGRPYIIELAGQSTQATITDLKFKLSYQNLQHIAGKRLHRGELAEVNLSFAGELAFDAFDKLPETGVFILRDRISLVEVAVGTVRFGLRRATNIHRQPIDIDVEARARSKGQQPCCIWFTGLSGSGKSTIANALETRLHELGYHTYILDGDNVRHGLNRDLGFKDADRVENIRRIGEVAKLMVDAGLIVMTAFISPFRSERRLARDLFGQSQFIEVFVDTPLEICEQRDRKGLYKKARAGEIANFTGISSAYELPERPELAINAIERDIDELVEDIISELEKRDILSPGKSG